MDVIDRVQVCSQLTVDIKLAFIVFVIINRPKNVQNAANKLIMDTA